MDQHVSAAGEGLRATRRRPHALGRGGAAVVLSLLVVAVAATAVTVVVAGSSATQWTLQRLPSPSSMQLVSMISCSDVSGCVAIASDNQVLYLTPGARSWGIGDPLVDALSLDLGVSCTARGCYTATSTVGRDGFSDQMTLYGIRNGTITSYRYETAPRSQGFTGIDGNGMSCTALGTYCMLLTEGDLAHAGIYPTTTTTWESFGVGRLQPRLEPVSLTALTATSPEPPLVPVCARPFACLALSGVQLWSTSDGGRRWHWTDPFHGAVATALACGGRSACVVGTNAGYVYFTNALGTSLRRSVVPGWSCATTSCESLDGVAGLACWSARACVAVSDHSKIDLTTDAGRTWIATSLPSEMQVDAVSCAAAFRCWAVGSLHDRAAIVELHRR